MSLSPADLRSCASIVAFAVYLSGAPAIAQETPENSEVAPGEIIVTANKREQSVNDVGLTIQAASGEELASRGITGPADLAKLVPGFTFTQSLYSTPVYTLRGIGLYDATFGAAPSVSVYSDQIPRNFPVMSDALDLDIERVEVLKGPQGTLFGQSSTGGAINYIVAKPTDTMEAGVGGSYERFDRIEASGFLSGPLGEGVNARLALKGVTGGAWQRSISRPNDENGDSRKYSGRLTVDLEPADSLKIELMATGAIDKSDPLAPQYAGTIFNIYSAASLAAANANPATRNPFGMVDEARYAALTNPASPHESDHRQLGRRGSSYSGHPDRIGKRACGGMDARSARQVRQQLLPVVWSDRLGGCDGHHAHLAVSRGAAEAGLCTRPGCDNGGCGGRADFRQGPYVQSGAASVGRKRPGELAHWRKL